MKVLAVYVYKPDYFGQKMISSHVLVEGDDERFWKTGYFADDDGNVFTGTLKAVETDDHGCWQMVKMENEDS